jgi:hypothetical protein
MAAVVTQRSSMVVRSCVPQRGRRSEAVFMPAASRNASYGRWGPVEGEAPCWGRWREIERRCLGHLEAARLAGLGKQSSEPIPYTGGDEDD